MVNEYRATQSKESREGSHVGEKKRQKGDERTLRPARRLGFLSSYHSFNDLLSFFAPCFHFFSSWFLLLTVYLFFSCLFTPLIFYISSHLLPSDFLPPPRPVTSSFFSFLVSASPAMLYIPIWFLLFYLILYFTFLYLLPSYVFVCLFSFSSPLSFQTFHFLFSFTHVLLLSPSFHFPYFFLLLFTLPSSVSSFLCHPLASFSLI